MTMTTGFKGAAGFPSHQLIDSSSLPSLSVFLTQSSLAHGFPPAVCYQAKKSVWLEIKIPLEYDTLQEGKEMLNCERSVRVSRWTGAGEAEMRAMASRWQCEHAARQRQPPLPRPASPSRPIPEDQDLQLVLHIFKVDFQRSTSHLSSPGQML